MEEEKKGEKKMKKEKGKEETEGGREDGVRQERWEERGAMKEKRILGRRLRRNLFLSAFIQ